MYHIIAFVAGYLLDLILGDPYSFPHPIKCIGNRISFYDKRLRSMDDPDEKRLIRRGGLMVFLVCLEAAVVYAILLSCSYNFNNIIGCIVEAVMTYQLLATKCLKDESMKVYDKLENGTTEQARKSVAMIVGRDTDSLDREQVIKACVETVAENASDGCIAPMLYLALFGPVGGIIYKAVNTMDSMVGYKNDKYMFFGRVAAKTDDVLNFIPARISGLLFVVSCIFLGDDFNTASSFDILKRDRKKHSSPNSAHTEAACAGALGVRLAGDAYYFGKLVKKEYIGDMKREVVSKDIIRANKMLYMSTFLCGLICVAGMTVITCMAETFTITKLILIFQ